MDWMIDIETLGTKGMPALLEISCISFEGAGYKEMIDWPSCIDMGATIDSDTVRWHKKQGTDLYVQGSPINEAIICLIARLKSVGVTTIWANSPGFDLEILKKYFNELGYDCPWKYHQERDVRTLRKVFGEDLNNNHDSYQDCLNQISVVKSCLEKVNSLS